MDTVQAVGDATPPRRRRYQPLESLRTDANCDVGFVRRIGSCIFLGSNFNQRNLTTSNRSFVAVISPLSASSYCYCLNYVWTMPFIASCLKLFHQRICAFFCVSRRRRVAIRAAQQRTWMTLHAVVYRLPSARRTAVRHERPFAFNGVTHECNQLA